MVEKESFYRHLCSLVPHPETKRFLLAVSGGKDSIAMAHLFFSCHLDFEIAHCNFHLRGTDSNEDEHFVREWAEMHKKKCHVKHFNTLDVQKNSGKSVEMVARDLRYAWFAEMDKDYDFVVTAHHANDNAETLLLNLARGTGLKGLTGIPPLQGKFLRPFLPFSVDEILHYIEKQNLDYRTDASNFSQQYHRNRIRHAVMPELRVINPEIIATFTKNIAHFQQQFAFYERQVRLFSSEIMQKNGEKWQISIQKLQSHPDGLLLLYEILKPFGFSEDVCRNIFRALSEKSGAFFYSADYQLLKDRTFLILQPQKEMPLAEIWCHSAEELAREGFEVELLSINIPPIFSRETDILLADAAKFQFPVLLRGWHAGDSFCPFGMQGKQKLSDFFNNHKLDRFSKQQVKLLCVGGEIAWIVGHRTDRRFKIDEHTQYYYKITYHGRI